ncbi:MAG: UDP-glucose/GDP-mannose dehydrogenase family protein [Gammaproteobacteria bacterium]
MKVSIYGCGYVGLVTGTCLAELGHEVMCVDIDPRKISLLNKGATPIFEPGLTELIRKHLDSKKLQFTTDQKKAVSHGILQFICVNTPSTDNGSANIEYVLSVAKTIATEINEYKLIINKSTAPVGTVHKIKTCLQENVKNSISFDVASNPEFLKEGSAITDFLTPDRIILGVENESTVEYFKKLYKYFPEEKLIFMDIPSAELTKYAANAMLATRISFINEIANLSELVGANIEEIARGIGLDPRIGPYFLAPGCGFGGSCFPKDLQALIHFMKEKNLKTSLLSAVVKVNDEQKLILLNKILKYFSNDISHRVFALWGLSFKPNTDDIREASSCALLEGLWSHNAVVKAYDPAAMAAIEKKYGQRNDLILCENATDCLNDADALIIVTEWPEFKTVNLNVVKESLKSPVIFDGRNIFKPNDLKSLGLEYLSVGR